MPFPSIDAFSFEDGWDRWVATAKDGGYDLAVPDERGRPLAAALTLLQRAEADQAELLRRALGELKGFGLTEKIDLNVPPAMIELAVIRHRGKLAACIVLNFDSDRYGLYVVGFSLSLDKYWSRVFFSREDW